MITTTHAVVNATLLGRKNDTGPYVPVILGAFFPDIPGFLCLMLNVAQYASGGAWDTSYYSSQWMPWVDWAHSIPLALAGIPIFLLVRYRFGLYFCFSMFLHDLEDLFVHSVRSHRHFLPFSDYRFISPLSCTEPRYHANLGAPMEWGILLACSFLLWRRGIPLWAKWALFFICVAHGIGLAHFLLIGIHQVPF